MSNPQDVVFTLYDLGLIYLVDEGKLFKQASEANMPKIIAVISLLRYSSSSG